MPVYVLGFNLCILDPKFECFGRCVDTTFVSLEATEKCCISSLKLPVRHQNVYINVCRQAFRKYPKFKYLTVTKAFKNLKKNILSIIFRTARRLYKTAVYF